MHEETLVREMATTAQEFQRVLAWAFPSGMSARDGVLRVHADGAMMEIVLRTLPPRVIGQLALPRLEVRIRFNGGTAEQRRALLRRMDGALQRGGG